MQKITNFFLDKIPTVLLAWLLVVMWLFLSNRKPK